MPVYLGFGVCLGIPKGGFMFDQRTLKVAPARPRAGAPAVAVLVLLGLAALAMAAFGSPRLPVASPPEAELPPAAASALPAGFEHAAPTDDGRIQVLVELRDAPAATVFAEAMRGSRPSDRQALAAAGAASKTQVLK